MQGHTVESVDELPHFLMQAISAQLEVGYAGPNAVRRNLHERYAQFMHSYNQFGKVNFKPWNEKEIVPRDEHLPPAGWTEEDVTEARNQRLEREMDERSGQRNS